MACDVINSKSGNEIKFKWNEIKLKGQIENGIFSWVSFKKVVLIFVAQIGAKKAIWKGGWKKGGGIPYDKVHKSEGNEWRQFRAPSCKATQVRVCSGIGKLKKEDKLLNEIDGMLFMK